MAAVCAVVCIHVLLSLWVPRSFALTAVGDLTQSTLLLWATARVLSNIRATHKKATLFWGLLGLGFGMWACTQLLWTYFEVFLRQEVPNPFLGDVILFLHIVPLMAALAVQPHEQSDDRLIRADSLDLVLLLTWWLYLYLFVVIPWQYVHPAESLYGSSFDVLYGCEQLAFVFGLLLVWQRSQGTWRSIYGHLCGASLLYGLGSIAASEAIDFHIYYTGSLFDVPLVAAMAWYVGVGCMARKAPLPDTTSEAKAHEHGIWKTRIAMLAVFMTPLMVAWAEFCGDAPQSVRTYRVLLTVGVMLVMGALVFLKQHFLDRELLDLLSLSRRNLEETCRLKDELQDKEHSLRWHSEELQRKNVELQEISFTDSLTDVWNRRYMEEILPAEAGQVLRTYQRADGADLRKLDHRDLVFIMVDMDFFKEVNDHFGHPAGDRLLQLVAERLSTVVRKSDVLVRWGGEEFLIMSRSADPAGTPAFCARILEVMESAPFDLGHGVLIRKTCSVGWASYPWCRSAFEAVCAEEVITLADVALYRAKALGRNQGIGIVPTDAASTAPDRITLEAIQEEEHPLTRMIRTECPRRKEDSRTAMPGNEVTENSAI